MTGGDVVNVMFAALLGSFSLGMVSKLMSSSEPVLIACIYRLLLSAAYVGWAVSCFCLHHDQIC
jgi:hypothetical protein